MNLVPILLAAGTASRFGSDKLLHLLPHDVPIAAQSARHLKAAFRNQRIVAVVRPGSAALRKVLEAEDCDVVVCPGAAEGMGASLACAVQAAGPADGYLVALADMPFIRPSTIEAVRGAMEEGAPIAAPYFRARRGHPVGISGRFFAELSALTGDEGARRLLAGQEVRKVPVGDPGVLRDIDTPGDLAPPLVV